MGLTTVPANLEKVSGFKNNLSQKLYEIKKEKFNEYTKVVDIDGEDNMNMINKND